MSIHVSLDVIALIAAIVGLGVAAQFLAAKYRVPSVLFLILAGVAIGPEGLGLITSGTFGDSLSTIVGVSVAIIVFEGTFHLEYRAIREASKAVDRMITIGAGIAFVGTALTVRLLLGASWDIAFLIGALLIATGPTVVAPILAVVPVREEVATTLEVEGIVNDVTAAVLAIVLFKAMTARDLAPRGYVWLFVQRLALGVLVGLVVAGVVWYLLTEVELPAEAAPQTARLLALAGAVIAFAAADSVFSEAGIVAAATAGFVLGNLDLPHQKGILRFKRDITSLVLSFVFITLAALLEFEELFALGITGLVVVTVLMVVIRPLAVFVSTAGAGFTTNERLFMSFVGPRGIIPASVATLFAVRLQTEAPPTDPAGANILLGTVFLAILVTVVIEAGFARRIAGILGVTMSGQ
ncbi:cation:proton antiporter [Halalkalicoccus jeotgali]|uniref:TrkA-N domain protein n=1 Tax=Halalkalicoccus jeotgali (strain DSM 18796 / CECT 7217 / JCM 14584 / KCTC 4019 / B3) TaxID=795797 RepID=D8J6L4_HALJB|nr:cation:proton antiporter [Halalkalicoccus jeotgali]ADJ13891.1 TrkA-N domain protein [Halalkalicoccus jeotgali B3]ELY34062.1 TrkA-N domain-containing protein [Halalkalicoccus jeotgali B3]